MRILVSGATGLIGSAVVAMCQARGDVAVPLVREGGTAQGVRWGADGQLAPQDVSGFDAVIHLAGEPLANGRWTEAKKRRIRDSRIEGTQRLVAALHAAEQPPKVLVSASGINYYGDCGDAVVDESQPPGRGFLSAACPEWEGAANDLGDVARVVTLRIGVVLTPTGGALAEMLPLFRSRLAGPIAGGKRFISWITLHDLVRVIEHALASEGLRGPVNCVSPEPVRGAEFTRLIAAAVGKPAVVPVPAWMARLMLGEMADETVLASIRAVPKRLLEDGFVFRDTGLEGALAGWGLRG